MPRASTGTAVAGVSRRSHAVQKLTDEGWAVRAGFALLVVDSEFAKVELEVRARAPTAQVRFAV